jgi:hypothetical protein
MPNNTVRLSELLAPTGTLLSDVRDGRMSWSDYLSALRTSRSMAWGWQPDGSWLIDFGQGIADPCDKPLDINDVLAIVRQIMPTPLRSAGKTIVLRGPMPGATVALVCRVCYAANVVIEVVDRATGTVRRVEIERMARDRVRLVNPDCAETLRDVGNGIVEVRTSQIVYRRTRTAPPFAYHNDLELVFLETRSPRRSNIRAQVYDGRYYAWVDDVSNLEDVP